MVHLAGVAASLYVNDEVGIMLGALECVVVFVVDAFSLLPDDSCVEELEPCEVPDDEVEGTSGANEPRR
jgi:hypothetical protein